VVPSGPIKEAALKLGFDLVGVCPASVAKSHDFYLAWLEQGFAGSMDYLGRRAALKESPESLLAGAKSVIAVGLNYYQAIAPRDGFARIARYALGRDYHKVMRSKLKKLAACLGTTAVHRICVDSAPVLEREFAQRAGLGWFGKNTMLIDSRRGSWFLIGLLLTTLEIEPDEPAVGGCGSCTACIDACPTGAIVPIGDRWAVDARTCISYLTIEAPEEADSRVGEWTFGCDVCQEVCPFNQPRASQPLRATVTNEPDFLNRTGLASLPLADISHLEHAEWNRITEGSPIRRAGLQGLQRVAKLNLEN
jgi:epoxyqueuosine reductase